ncbi:MAG: hydroxyethylthiazole kinase [Bacillota bacterium]
MVVDLLRVIREKKPLIHHITNNVTVNDCANITLCTGALPVMAYSLDEAHEMVGMAGALVLNIGTLDKEQVKAMIKAAKTANEKGIPVVLDPVGVGATVLRTESAKEILNETKVDIIKGNQAEISILSGQGGIIKGVESIGDYDNIQGAASTLARMNNCVVVVSGAKDIVTDGSRLIRVANGHALMGQVVGTGCMAASVIGCFAAVHEDKLKASAAGLVVFGIAGEMAAEQEGVGGPGSFKIALFDCMSKIDYDKIESKIKLEMGL